MTRSPDSDEQRVLKEVRLGADLVVAGGGLAGVCAAVTAARAGARVVLIQDRPVLGGNASSEIRLWILGATSHMGNNNRWAREGGVIDEILVENLARNPEGNAVLVDSVLLEKVRREPNITLLLNTAVHELEKSGPGTIRAVRAFCSQNQTAYAAEAPLYCDASGDGILAFLAGAAFRMGAESRAEFGEGFAQDQAYGELLGHSLYFYSRDTGRPVKFVPPDFALADITTIPHWRDFSASSSGCRLWWLEYGGRTDTVHDTEEIKWELWRVAYGVWNYIKNSGKFPEAETLTLEWVGSIPGKRESRRFEGDYMLIQQDVVEQRAHPDVVSHGGWAMDLHPADGVYSELPTCTQWHSKGVYQIPYRCLYSRNITNLFLAGRIISVSHVAFGSTRVMATCANSAQAAGMAAALCVRDGVLPRDLNQPARMQALQRELMKAGQYIPGHRLEDPEDLAQHAEISASSRMVLAELEPGGGVRPLDAERGMLLPVNAGPMPRLTFRLDVSAPTTLVSELRASSRYGNYTPDITLARREIELLAGDDQAVTLAFESEIPKDQYVLVCLFQNPAISVHLSDHRITGVLSLAHAQNAAVAKSATQRPPDGSGIDSFEFWLPERRPGGRNMALSIEPPLDVYRAENVVNGVTRPTTQPNAWVADLKDISPRLTLRWRQPQRIARVALAFDTDFDHPMESVLLGHPERYMPFSVKSYRITDESGRVLHQTTDNYQTRNLVRFTTPVTIVELHVEVLATHGAPAALFEVRCYSE